MATYSFEYTKGTIPASEAFPAGHTVKRPYLEVRLASKEQETGTFCAMVDTGADYCMFSADHLPTLGLTFDFLPVAPAFGLGSDSNIRFAYVRLKNKDLGDWLIYAGFSKSMNSLDPSLLGHSGFLERFKAKFDYANGLLSLEDLPLKS